MTNLIVSGLRGAAKLFGRCFSPYRSKELAILLSIMGGMGVIGGMILSDYDKKKLNEAISDLTIEELDAAVTSCYELSGREEVLCYDSFDKDAGAKD